ncbi:MAG TPA: adenine phosphoribosyltransferase [Planctomycetota bacterium]|nr:adenine phosphoribosyltransferase [Planctomycetota bacterium]
MDDPLKAAIRGVRDFPKKGIVFRDITPVLVDPALLRETVERLSEPFYEEKVQVVAGTEARGFILAPAVALHLAAGFVPIRKKGKLPCATFEASYELEYGTDTLEMHRDAIRPGTRVLMVDDLLATGGTMKACCDMVRAAGGVIVGCAFLVELAFLGGRRKLEPHSVFTLVQYASEEE